MQNTVPATFKTSGAPVTPPATPDPLESALRSAFDQGEPCDADGNPVAEDRSITYQLRHGGVLVEECPTWCVLDHADDIAKPIYAEDLVHEGEEIELSITTVEGDKDSILAARIQQWPYATDGNGSDVPYMAYRANANYGESMGYSTPTDVEAEIRRTEAHLYALRQLNERLAEARADFLDKRGPAAADLTVADVRTLPVPVLLKAFGLAVVEVESIPYGIQGVLDRTGDVPVVVLLRSLPQAGRESLVRQLLVSMVEGQA
ncbi:DUF6907 domain-containing protein [Streptomyces sp. NBC_00236]|uniref:DUF6907 domain-containing protein n=1 Tax=Streptomyces sp. NBC_00236 TaxID=2903639 RepID=UPI002E2E61DA|nr:hypothetical protein [Streptomyces sp. NBC_00236]